MPLDYGGGMPANDIALASFPTAKKILLRQKNCTSDRGNNNTPVTNTGSKPFIEANTIESTLLEIQQRHIIPTYRDSEALISQAEFIEVTGEVVHDVFKAERITAPSIRLSHPIKGRVPEARNKPASELNEWEKTLYYERMAFIQEITSITDSIDWQTLSLTVGGVKAYNLDNLQNRKGADEHFKVFIGFSVRSVPTCASGRMALLVMFV